VTRRKSVFSYAGCLLLIMVLVLSAGYWHWRVSPDRGLPYRSAFQQQAATEWTAFGGAWSVQNGIMRNSSDERGAKLVTGSAYWRDYVLDADLRFLGTGGDVGLIVRSGSEETGVDAYNGYYVGLRSFDNALVAGRADYGWSEARPVPAPGTIQPFAWFHLKIVAVGCNIAASAKNLATGQTSYIAVRESRCASSGRIGLRSLATGGEWRDLIVAKATQADADALIQRAPSVEQLLYPRTEAEYNQLISFMTAPHVDASPSAQPPIAIENLRAPSRFEGQQVNVRGVITLLRPEFFVQDATGGIAVHLESPANPGLNLGDEVEMQGQAYPGALDRLSMPTIRNATLHLLWDRSPASPISIDALQATTADVSGRLVEMQGQVIAEKEDADKIILSLESGDQAFRAIVDKPGGGLRIPMFAPHSLVRLRGICIHDERYTKRLTPFVLLLRSADDIDQIAGAPWWSPRRLLPEIVLALLLLLLLQAYHGHMQRQRRAAITGERERLAHELHDTLAQTFAGLAFQLHGIRNRLRLRESAPFDMVDQQLEAASDFVRRTHQEASLSIAMLRSHSPEISDLASALERSASELTTPNIATVHVVGDSNSHDMPLRITDALFHIGREALVNAVRHANAQKIDITIAFERNSLSLEVADNGIGFQRDPGCQRLGLKGIEHRAAGIHAAIRIDSKPGEGTRVKVTVPLSRRRFLFATRNKSSL
jgi:signal transduction histidine kinase